MSKATGRIIRHRTGRGGWTRWIQPRLAGYLVQCCDCGLVHEIAFRVVGQRVEYRARRARRQANRTRETAP